MLCHCASYCIVLLLLIVPGRTDDVASHSESHQYNQPHRDPLREGGRSHDKDHIQEHLRDLANVSIEDMSEEELQFHYFKLHDYDNNNYLDGLELVAALTHFDDVKPHDAEGEDHNKEHDEGDDVTDIVSDEDAMTMVDQVLEQEDANRDGLISYAEFRRAQGEHINSVKEEESRDSNRV